MADTKTRMIRDEVLHYLEEVSADRSDQPEPPSSYFMASIELMAMSVFERNGTLSKWMHRQGLDPHMGPDAVLGVAMMLILDAKKNPRPAPLADDEIEDDH
ncbi:hypothetical protein [Sphingobium nicotianae]|uniref:Uncharacterized protein n=1 Tax=Sphingobium nicotianae TaxID=2782607 RepID=A0A9X1DAA8_9SPHN|nr:hypothetical protein [Sphingobium nicotianae]MBT2186310.1 hypothetical protein [Sphingobium nicotianae]